MSQSNVVRLDSRSNAQASWQTLCSRADLVANSGVVAWHEGAQVALFHLPDNAVPVCIVPVGYPDGQRFGPTNRKPAETVAYWDDWGVAKARA